MVTEQVHLQQLRESVGHLTPRQDQAYHVTGHLQKAQKRGERPARTCNLALVCLRNVLKNAKIDGYIKSLPSGRHPLAAH